MPWFRLDDEFFSHPKVLMAGNAAVGLFVRCGTWCANQGTEGRIPVEAAKSFGTKREIDKLTTVCLWVRDGDEFVIPDYLEYNPSNDEVEALRSKRADAGRQGGALGNHRRHHVAKGILNPNCQFCTSPNGRQNDRQMPTEPIGKPSANPRPGPGPEPLSDLHPQSVFHEVVEHAVDRLEAAYPARTKSPAYRQSLRDDVIAKHSGEINDALRRYPNMTPQFHARQLNLGSNVA